MNLHDQYDTISSEADSRLDTKASPGALRICPSDLEIRNDEPACRTCKIEPGAHLTNFFRIAVKTVCCNGYGRDHDAKNVKSPTEGRKHVVPPSFNSEAKHKQARNHAWGAYGDSHRPVFWFELAFTVSLHQNIGYPVVQPASRDLSKDCRDDRREVKEADGLDATVIWWRSDEIESVVLMPNTQANVTI